MKKWTWEKNEETGNMEFVVVEKIGLKPIKCIPEFEDFRDMVWELSDWSQIQKIRDALPEDTENYDENDWNASELADAMESEFNYPDFQKDHFVQSVCMGLGWFAVRNSVPSGFADIYDGAKEEVRGWLAESENSEDNLKIAATRSGLCELFTKQIQAWNPEFKGLKMSARAVRMFMIGLASLKAGTVGKKGSKVGTTKVTWMPIEKAYRLACTAMLMSLGVIKDDNIKAIKKYGF